MSKHSGTPPSVSSKIQQGLQYHQQGQFEKALTTYRAVLDDQPNSAAAHLAGRALFDLGRPDESIAMLQLAVRVDPRNANAWNDLGNVFSDAKHNEKALDAYRHAFSSLPDHPDAGVNLAVCLKDMQRLDEAQDVLERIIAQQPSAHAYYLLGTVNHKLNFTLSAVESLRKAISLQPGMSEAHRQLVAVLRSDQQTDEMTKALHDWIRNVPDNPVPRHLIQSIGPAPARASDDYVRTVFDQFAETFEDSLADLQYDVPAQITELIRQHVKSTDAVILDAGCGTGLCGPHLRTLAARLVGVDLSEKMIEKAHAGNQYDELYVDELTRFIQKHAETYDVIQAADTLNYFGDLAPVFAAAQSALRDNGLVAFTLEAGDHEGFRLGTTGRFCHGEDYVATELQNAGFELLGTHKLQIRIQANEPVHGWCFIAKKSA